MLVQLNVTAINHQGDKDSSNASLTINSSLATKRH